MFLFIQGEYDLLLINSIMYLSVNHKHNIAKIQEIMVKNTEIVGDTLDVYQEQFIQYNQLAVSLNHQPNHHSSFGLSK